MSSNTLIGLTVLVVLFTLEAVLPYYQRQPGARGDGRYRHALQNLSLAVTAGALGALMAPLILLSVQFAADHGIGLCNAAPMHPALCGLLAFVLFDLWMYAWHRANHEISFLWRFHRVHHTDPAMDSTTALRFHPGEILFSTLLNCLVLAAIGMSLEAFAVYKSVMIAVILFHHSNVRIPDALDRRLRVLIVPPSMHRVHHSELRVETDSNYGTVFSFWDRLFGSYRTRRSYQDIRFGIGAYDTPDWQRPLQLLMLPFKTLATETSCAGQAPNVPPTEGRR
jgi:sterol desaturase/sphingolipid hydroxylase (fatty acid hydroxylase superfamily)